MLVLDASVATAWIFPDEVSAYSERVLDDLRTSGAVVPDVWPFQIANVLLVAERRGRLTELQTARALADIEQFQIRVAGSSSIRTVSSLLALGRQERMSAYDASYLDLAIRERLPFATLDERLRTAARSLGLTLFQ
jgi:predicted nucleic acid-binding protein